jgi:hypothetical protein
MVLERKALRGLANDSGDDLPNENDAKVHTIG